MFSNALTVIRRLCRSLVTGNITAGPHIGDGRFSAVIGDDAETTGIWIQYDLTSLLPGSFGCRRGDCRDCHEVAIDASARRFHRGHPTASLCAHGISEGDPHDLGARKRQRRSQSCGVFGEQRVFDDTNSFTGENAVIDEQATNGSRGDDAGAIIVGKGEVDGVAASRPDPRVRPKANELGWTSDGQCPTAIGEIANCRRPFERFYAGSESVGDASSGRSRSCRWIGAQAAAQTKLVIDEHGLASGARTRSGCRQTSGATADHTHVDLALRDLRYAVGGPIWQIAEAR